MTQNSQFNAFSQNINASSTRAFKAQQQVASGLRVMTADDDPVAAARAALLSSSVSSLEAMGRVSAVAESQLATAEEAISSAQELLGRARELAVMGANGSYSAEERQHIAAEAQVLHDTMLTLANTDVGGTYIFAGTSGVQPFDDTGLYAGDGGYRALDVAPGVRIQANLPGDSVFNVVGGQNIIGLMSDLATGLNTDDVPMVHNVIENLDKSMDQLNSARSLIGGSRSQILLANDQRTESNILLRKDRSDTIEVDQAEALVRMMEAQTAYQTALSEAARIIAQMQNNPLVR